MNYQFPYEKLDIWKLSIEMSVYIYKTLEKLLSNERFGMISQISRSCNSIGANIAEGSARKSAKDKARFIEISYG